MEQEQKKEEIIPGYASIEEFTKNGFRVLVEATKASNALPADRDWDFYKVHGSFNKILNCEGDRVLRLMNDILHTQQHTANIRNRDLEEKTEMVIEANDDLLEKVASGIDELNGIRKLPEPIEIQTVSARLPVNGSWNQLNKATFSVNSSIDAAVNDKNVSAKSVTLLTAKNIIRPQTFFKDKIDNRNCRPWIPRITEKPNSVKPLAIFLEETEFGELYSHPYEFELDRFTPLPEQLQKATPVELKSLEETPLIEVSTQEKLDELVHELRKHTEFAIDLEHHSYRTFMGITCLMQISTKDADYLVDTFTLRDKLCILNEVFTKPSIVKIFHGADHDIEWLQRDLSLYVVNMFDTHQAAKQLEYSGLSLAYLMNRFCNVVPNKHFQLADWRIRPLPEQLKTYARMDTHYLIYIFQMLKNELLKKGNGSDNILKSVIQRSTQICQKRYVKPILREDSHLDFYLKCKRLFDNRQMYALKELYHWRDTLARAEDESTGYVLPNHMLLQIAETLPREMQGILACCNPIPPLVRSNLLELHRIILRAREQSSVKPILKEDNRSRGSTLQFAKINTDSPLHCPHDLSKSAEFRDDLPTLLGNRLKSKEENKSVVSESAQAVTKLKKIKSIYSVFNVSENFENEAESETQLKIRNVSFLAPYERYKLVKPFIQAEEEKAAAAREKDATKQKDVKNNDDRIAALHAHFVKVAKETPQKMPDETDTEPNANKKKTPQKRKAETLVAMGGSKKRKTNQSEDVIEFHPDYTIPDNTLHTPLPNWKNKKPNRRPQKNKKKFDQNQTPPNQPRTPQNQQGNRKKNRRPSKQNKFKPQQNTGAPPNQMPNRQMETPPQNRQMQTPPQNHQMQTPPQNRQKQPPPHQMHNQNQTPRNQKQNRQNQTPPNQKQNRKKPHRNFNNQTPQQVQNVNQETPPHVSEFNGSMSNRQRKRQEWIERTKNWKNKKGNANQISDPQVHDAQKNTFTPFDYSTVDFQQFQGGAGGSNQKGVVQTQFKAKNKNKKANKKSNNRSLVYARRK